MEHDSTGPEPSGLNPHSEEQTPEPEIDVAARLRELEEEADRLRSQLKAQDAEEDLADTKPEEHPEQEDEGSASPNLTASPVAADSDTEAGATAEPPVETLPPPPSPEVQAEVENMVRRAKVAKMRGQARECMDLLMQAEKLAPNFAPLLEALGDEMAAKSRWKDAQAIYGRAARLEPGKVGIERKFAQAVLHASVPVEAMLMGATSSASLIEEAANAKTAAIWSGLLPGVGQIVLGETGKGIGFMAGWIVSWTVALLIPNGLKGLVSLAGSKPGDSNMIVLLPLFVAIVVWISAVFDANSHAKTIKKPNVERPRPPVDLPFE